MGIGARQVRTPIAILVSLALALVLFAGIGVNRAQAQSAGTYALSNWSDCGGGYNNGSWDAAGNLYIPCGNPSTIRVYDSAGTKTADISVPHFVYDVVPSLDAGRPDYLYLTGRGAPPKRLKWENNQYTADADWSLGTYKNAAGANLSNPTGTYMATDNAGNVYLAEGEWSANETQMVIKYGPQGGAALASFKGIPSDSTGKLSGIAVSGDGKRVYTTEYNGADGQRNAVHRFDSADGTTYTRNAAAMVGGAYDSGKACTWVEPGQTTIPSPWNAGGFAYPYDVALDENGNLYVLNTTCNEVLKFNNAGAFQTGTKLGSAPPKPHGFAVSKDGRRVYIGESGKTMTLQGDPPPPGDVTAPASTVSPGANAVGVPGDANVTATFDEAVQAGVSLTLKRTSDNANVLGAFNYDAPTRTAKMDPTNALEAGVSYTATLSGVKDTAGNAAGNKTWTFTTAGGGGATFRCDGFAAASGNDDTNTGLTAASPVQTIRTLAGKLQPGQTGCLKSGDTFHMDNGWGNIKQSGTDGLPITIRSAPGGRATVTGSVRVDGNHVVVRDINFRGLGAVADTYPRTNHIHVVGDNVSMLDNDITSPMGICLSVGTIESYTAPDAPTQTANSAQNFRLDGNRVYGCGMNNPLDPTAHSGMHGVYLAYTENARITNNYIYGNRVRGLQLYSRAEGTLVENNVIDGNSGNLNIGGSTHERGPNGNYGYFVSINNTVRNNIISNSTFAYSSDQYEVFGNYKTTATADEYGNLATGNCVYNQDASKRFGGTGIAQNANQSDNPMYVNRAAGNFALQNGSPCAGKGPQQGGDTTAPTSNVFPYADSTDVTTNVVMATFSEEMMASSINANTFTLKKASDNSAVNGTVGYTPVGHEARLTVAAPLAADTQYTATLNGVKDLAGNAHAPKSWSFRTARGEANLAPTIADMLPADGSSTTDTRPRLSATVRDDAPLGKANIRLRVDGSLIGDDRYAYFPDTGSLWRVFEPQDASFGYGSHTVGITVTDAQGNTTSKTSTFRVNDPNADTTAPTGAITVKNGDAYSNVLGVALTLSASDNAGGTGVKEMRFRNGVGGVWSAWEPFKATRAWTLANVQGTPQEVHAQFRDGKTNESAVAVDSITLDTARPRVSSVLPVATKPAPVTTSAVAYFPAAEKLPLSSLNSNTFYLRVKGTTTKVLATYRYDETQQMDRAILTPTKPLLRGKTYQVVMTSGVKDMAGNALDQDPKASGWQGKVWYFNTRL